MKFTSAYLAIAVLLLSQPLLAHTKLGGSTPADGAHVPAPTVITLEFTADVRLTAVKLENDAGETIETGPVPGEAATSFAVAINDTLAPGRYRVSWRSVSGDSHIVSGEFRFTVTG